MVAIKAKPQSGTNLMRKYEIKDAKNAYNINQLSMTQDSAKSQTYCTSRVDILGENDPLRLNDEKVDELLDIVK